MYSDPHHRGPQKPLRSKGSKPIKRAGFMTISGISSSGSIAYGQPASRTPAQPPADDQMSMSLSADTFSSLVSDAGQLPDVRGEVVDAYKSRIQSGEYPSSDTLDNLTDLMGSHWSQFAAAGGASESSSAS
jgi:hypothetical protein